MDTVRLVADSPLMQMAMGSGGQCVLATAMLALHTISSASYNSPDRKGCYLLYTFTSSQIANDITVLANKKLKVWHQIISF